jgi:hypothetical protein
VILLTQYSLGIVVNLYSTLPADPGRSVFPGLAAAVGKGPVLLTPVGASGNATPVHSVPELEGSKGLRQVRLLPLSTMSTSLAG